MDKNQRVRRSGLLQALGPGIIYAGAAIGVSHLVQSTRAGANYGFGLVWAVLLANLMKYPFFEFGHRYTASTGESMLMGYLRVGRWALLSYLIIIFGLGLPTVAVVTMVNAGLASQTFTDSISTTWWAVILLLFCMGMLIAGGYPLLDKLMKAMMAFLAVSTLVAVIAAIARGYHPAPQTTVPPVWDAVGIGFLVALMGWMPTPVDVSVWPSMWMMERIKQTGYRPTLRHALFDFNLGYIATTVMALMFLTLGALVMFGSGESFAPGASGFAAQLVGMFTAALGDWSRPLIVVAAFTAMLSTVLTVIDGYPRVLGKCIELAWPRTESRSNLLYWGLMVFLVVGTWIILARFEKRMTPLVDLATILAFLSAPLLAFINWRVMVIGRVPREAAPPMWLHVLSWVGIAFLTAFSLLFLWSRYFGSVS